MKLRKKDCLTFSISLMLLLVVTNTISSLPKGTLISDLIQFYLKLSYASDNDDNNDKEPNQTIEDTFEPDDSSGDQHSGDSNSNSSPDNLKSDQHSGDSNSNSSPDNLKSDQHSGDSNSNSSPDNLKSDANSAHEVSEIGTVYVKVSSPYGNGLKPEDFTLKVRIEGNGNASPKSFAGDSHGTDIKFTGNALYSLKDTWSNLGYTIQYGSDCPAPGEKYPPTFTCHLTFNQKKPQSSSNTGQGNSPNSGTTTEKTHSTSTLNVVNLVINDNGGTLQDNNLAVSVKGSANPLPQSFAGNAKGTAVTFSKEGTYTVVQSAPPRYNITYSADCNGSISYGQTKTCTITSDDRFMTLFGATSYIRVVNSVVNDNGGSKAAADFNLNITNNNRSSIPVLPESTTSAGLLVPLEAGTYKVVENSNSGYDTTYSSDCSGSIERGQSKICTITNNDR